MAQVQRGASPAKTKRRYCFGRVFLKICERVLQGLVDSGVAARGSRHWELRLKGVKLRGRAFRLIGVGLGFRV